MKKKQNPQNDDLEIVLGDNSELEISEAKDCVNTLRPKSNENQNKKVIIPKKQNKK